jgi:hypothetical protein
MSDTGKSKRTIAENVTFRNFSCTAFAWLAVICCASAMWAADGENQSGKRTWKVGRVGPPRSGYHVYLSSASPGIGRDRLAAVGFSVMTLDGREDL